jgi:hypothetical protein
MAMKFMICGSFQKFFAEHRSRAAAIVMRRAALLLPVMRRPHAGPIVPTPARFQGLKRGPAGYAQIASTWSGSGVERCVR